MDDWDVDASADDEWGDHTDSDGTQKRRDDLAFEVAQERSEADEAALNAIPGASVFSPPTRDRDITPVATPADTTMCDGSNTYQAEYDAIAAAFASECASCTAINDHSLARVATPADTQMLDGSVDATRTVVGSSVEPLSTPVATRTPVALQPSVQDCSICLEAVAFPCSMPCSHHFHFTCIETLLVANRGGSTCPNCRVWIWHESRYVRANTIELLLWCFLLFVIIRVAS